MAFKKPLKVGVAILALISSFQEVAQYHRCFTSCSNRGYSKTCRSWPLLRLEHFTLHAEETESLDPPHDRFDDLDITRQTKRALKEELKVEHMTEVQERAIPLILSGSDVVARAQTGTGKTLAFLVPIIDLLARQKRENRREIGALILSPTRELAMQTAAAAQQLLTHHRDLGVFSMHGRTDINQEAEGLQSELLDIIVATPGRLDDHCKNSQGFADILSAVQFLVLDEADRLLNGFRDQVMAVLKRLRPPQERQSFLFSATFPNEISEIASLALRSNYVIVDTVKPGELVTPDLVEQHYAVIEQEKMVDVLWALVKQELEADPVAAKVIVFFTTARATQYFSGVFRLAGMDVIEMHSRRKQSGRTAAANAFWTAKNAVFFSTDVSARGLDYPDVSAVIHFGAPSSADRYVHRLGRTGRMGKSGKSILLLQDFEEHFLSTLKDIGQPKLLDLTCVSEAPSTLHQPLTKLRVTQVYKAWLGYYKYFYVPDRWDHEELVRQIGRFSASIGALEEDGTHPPLRRRTAQKLGLTQTTGLNVVTRIEFGDEEEEESSRMQRNSETEDYFKRNEDTQSAPGVMRNPDDKDRRTSSRDRRDDSRYQRNRHDDRDEDRRYQRNRHDDRDEDRRYQRYDERNDDDWPNNRNRHDDRDEDRRYQRFHERNDDEDWRNNRYDERSTGDWRSNRNRYTDRRELEHADQRYDDDRRIDDFDYESRYDNGRRDRDTRYQRYGDRRDEDFRNQDNFADGFDDHRRFQRYDDRYYGRDEDRRYQRNSYDDRSDNDPRYPRYQRNRDEDRDAPSSYQRSNPPPRAERGSERRQPSRSLSPALLAEREAAVAVIENSRLSALQKEKNVESQ